jgi:hypothetical protein
MNDFREAIQAYIAREARLVEKFGRHAPLRAGRSGGRNAAPFTR